MDLLCTDTGSFLVAYLSRFSLLSALATGQHYSLVDDRVNVGNSSADLQFKMMIITAAPPPTENITNPIPSPIFPVPVQ